MVERNQRSPVTRTSLFTPRRPQAACHYPASDSYLAHSLGWGIPLALSGVEGSQERNRRGLLPSPPHPNPHYKRCPKALRLCLRSDQSPSRPLNGRSPDKSRHSISRGHCQVRAPLTRRKGIAPSGDAPEHGVMLLPWAIAPCSDSHGLDLAVQSEQSDERRLKTNAPFLDSTVVTIGELRSTNAGLGSPLPSLGMVEHFWWSRPHRESFSRLLHIPSEVRGCRRAVTDLKHPLERTILIDTGVDAISRNRPGPSIPSPSPTPLLRHSRPRSGIHPRKGRLPAPRGIPSLPTHPLSHVIPMPREESGVGAPSPLRHPRSSHSVTPDPDRESIPGRAGCPLLGAYLPSPTANPAPPHPGKNENPREQSKITPEPAHQSKLPLPTPRKGASHPPLTDIFDRHKP